jgi:hypothetical protein
MNRYCAEPFLVAVYSFYCRPRQKEDIRGTLKIRYIPYRTKHKGYGIWRWSVTSMTGTDDRIRLLCAEALASNDETVLCAVLPELQAAIAEHLHNVRMKAAEEIPQVFRPTREAA